ncbi:flavin reductase family protein [Roseomonas marmotae]|uniref:Flavin reductase family protein n=1 Tax=Roseomonas marmotae TaxID=2768161 RepID=A0ABS3KCM0_9PROT|nr:flavin reductase family protein [Roseomonas marmotae]MBO1075214.1 flavin reductase family protein [Roseomonas marmotae]QTI79679.1 flavin reductase family protein [Roseomonas marmotae]
MRRYRKQDFPVAEIRRLMEPGPIVLVSSAWKGRRNVMTMGWHTVMEFTPSLIGCVIAAGNHSFEMVRRSRECVINIPEAALAEVVTRIGNCSGADTDKFAEFGLTAEPAEQVGAALIAECHSSLECRLADAALVGKYNFFIWEVVKAHVARRPKYPRSIHYRGEGNFMVAGESLSLKRLFRREYL